MNHQKSFVNAIMNRYIHDRKCKYHYRHILYAIISFIHSLNYSFIVTFVLIIKRILVIEK